MFDILLVVLLRIGQSGWVEHVHQRGETASAAVMRRGGQHDQRIGTGGKALGELGALCTTAVDGTVGDILGLVDHDDVPIRGIECRAILDVPFQRINGDDHLVVVGERVGVRRNLGTNLLDARGVQTNQRNSEPFPHLLLELDHHAFRCHHENTTSFAAFDEFRHQDTGLQGLAKTDGVSDENSLARLGERLLRRNELVWQGVHGSLVADMNPRIGRRSGT